MEKVARGVGMVALGLAGAGVVALHLLPGTKLHASTGTMIPYQPWNFLSEYARTDYGPLMTVCFFLLAVSVLSAALLVRHLRREAILVTLAGVALALLGIFPTDLSDLANGSDGCGLPGRIEPCTFIGRIHNPLSTLVFAPILLALICFCRRSRREPEWRIVARLALVCAGLVIGGIIAAFFYERMTGWQGAWWNGLMQRSLVFPALLWLAGLLANAKPPQATSVTGKEMVNGAV